MSTRRVTAETGARLYATDNPNSLAELRGVADHLDADRDVFNQREPDGAAADVPEAVVRDEPNRGALQGPRIPGDDDIMSIVLSGSRRSLRSSKSTTSHSSKTSSKIRALKKEEQLAAIREKERQNELEIAARNAEAKRLEDQRRLVELRADVEEELDFQDAENQSIHIEVPSRKPDVGEWAAQQAKSTGIINAENQQHPTGNLLQRAIQVDDPNRATPVNFGAQHDEYKVPKSKESDSFQKMADCFSSAMQNVIQSTVRPSDDLKNFVARQSGAKTLPEFKGDPEEWPIFYGRFVESTKLCGFSKEENLLRLHKSLKGKAKESVVSMLSSACNLDAIIDVLKKRFGRPDQIIKTMLEKARCSTAPAEGDFGSLVDFSIVVKNLCATAESLTLPLYLNNPQLVEEFRKKLPSHLQLEWGRHVVKTGKDADLKELSLFLDEVSSAAAYICDVNVTQLKKKNRDQCLVVTELKCPLNCKEAHDLPVCSKFKRMTVKERWDFVKKVRVCFCCLGKGHRIPDCPNPLHCKKDGCMKDHHPLLHYQPKSDDNSDKNVNRRPQDHNAIGVVSQVRVPLGNVLMKIVPVQLGGPKGKILVNAFLDDGSSLTIIDNEVADTLGLAGECHPLRLNWLGGRSDNDNNSRLVSLKIRGVDESEEYELSNVRTKVKLELPVSPLSNYKLLKKWKHLENVPFPDVLPNRPAIVIGEDHIHLMLARKLIEGARNTPVASWTYLGWVIHGPNGRHSGMKTSYTSMVNIENLSPDEALHELVKEQFRLESLGVVNCSKLPQSKQNQRADKLMESTSRRVGDRWETGMLWRTDDLTLPESKSAALRRLKMLEKQMDKDDSFAQMYCMKIEEYLGKGFCRKLSPEEAAVHNGRVWYLAHFGRTNPNKPGKLRLVFDCAAKVNGTSLNDALLQGPDLMSPLVNVLLKFRQREVAFSGDIRDMFHMVKIRQEDVPALRFLWRGKDRSRPPAVYTMDVMVFGAVSSPYQAQWVKNRNAEEFVEQFPEAVDAIQNRHYVDDYLDSTETTEEAIKKIMDVREVHRRGGFEIRGWLCNDPDVLKVVAPNEQLEQETLAVKENKLERVLGLFWDPKSDVFKFKTTFHNVDPKIIDGERIPTKRELLKLIMSLFDPLGFIAHLTVRGRMLLQDVWKSGIGWDEKLKADLEGKWSDLLRQILSIPETVIRRSLAPEISKAQEVQLHVLCDASSQAFSCVAYLRVTGRGGDVTVNIIMAKSRVAPIKCVSIPRLEMEAALIGARMSNFIRKSVDIKLDKLYLWSDSKNVLCWIRAEDPSRFKVYIAHRIGEILDLTEVENWRWVPTADNVADDATRDVAPADVSPSSRWFGGPSFLLEPEEMWPKERPVKMKDVNSEDLEMKKNICMMITDETVLPEVDKFSSWMRLVRVTAWMKRFVRNFAAFHGHGVKNPNHCLTLDEISNAVKVWIINCQESSFPEERNCLMDGKPISKSSKLSSLSPVLVEGIICVKSRIVNSPHLPQDAKYPAILESSHQWTKLLISWYHKMFGHHGVELICNEIRQRYWIVGLKSAVKRAARECLVCQMEGAKQVVPEMAALPEVRVRQPARAFTYVGVDYFGPMEVVNGRKREKRYGALFTCLSTRAVHLEMSFSLSTDDFLMALNRFICRRGEPEEIWSDNGTNFRGAENELKKSLKDMDQEKMEDQLAVRHIKWRFNPPGAPHMGGAWERLVRSVKIAMSTILKGRSVNDQVLLTVLAEAEASVNSRPLTTVSSDKDDSESLTPNCFLIGTTSIKQPPGLFDTGDLSTRKRWKHAQVLANHFWSRWLKEYLPSLSLRAKWNRETPDVVIGELVFVADSNQQRNQWTKAIVEAVYPGKDGRVRVVDVRTAAGSFRRPVAKLYRMDGWIKKRDSTT